MAIPHVTPGQAEATVERFNQVIDVANNVEQRAIDAEYYASESANSALMAQTYASQAQTSAEDASNQAQTAVESANAAINTADDAAVKAMNAEEQSQRAEDKAQSVVDRANAGEFKGEKGEPGEVEEAPTDGKQYTRKNSEWVEAVGGMPIYSPTINGDTLYINSENLSQPADGTRVMIEFAESVGFATRPSLVINNGNAFPIYRAASRGSSNLGTEADRIPLTFGNMSYTLIFRGSIWLIAEFPKPYWDDIFNAPSIVQETGSGINSIMSQDASSKVFATKAESITLGETSSTAYRGDRGKTAYDHTLNGEIHVTSAEKSTWNNTKTYAEDIATNKRVILNVSGGFAAGSQASADSGGASGLRAEAGTGGAVGYFSKTTSGGAIGANATSTTGGALGENAKATAAGAFQFGDGTNSTANTMQFRGYTFLDANGNIPDARLSSVLSTKQDKLSTTEINNIASIPNKADKTNTVTVNGITQQIGNNPNFTVATTASWKFGTFSVTAGSNNRTGTVSHGMGVVPTVVLLTIQTGGGGDAFTGAISITAKTNTTFTWKVGFGEAATIGWLGIP